jgi:hypothetical protein
MVFVVVVVENAGRKTSVRFTCAGDDDAVCVLGLRSADRRSSRIISSVLYRGKWIKNQESTLFIVIMRHDGRQCMK